MGWNVCELIQKNIWKKWIQFRPIRVVELNAVS